MNKVQIVSRILIGGALLAALWGCGNGNSNAPAFLNGVHPANWYATHGAAARASVPEYEKCAECHGQDLTGGISKVSCFSAGFNGQACHAGGPGEPHPAGWDDPAVHGSHAKMKASGANGLPYCQGCHGTRFDGGLARQSCYDCHGVSAPHPAKPWRGGTYTHTTTDPSNASVCALCHTAGANLTPSYRLASYASGAPGCFNGTLCHADVSGHPSGWSAYNQHGAAAKGAPDSSHGYSYCNGCHVDFRNGTGTSCFSCHTTAPHPAAPWLGTTASGTTHTTTNQGNAPQCARCHLNNQRLTTPVAVPPGTTPGCFNGTLCHAQTTGHSFPYPGAAHNSAAGASPFTACTGCHAMGSAASPYPVAAGVKPDCRACHAKSQPVGNVSRCDSCHGTSSNGGRPVGTAFPDRAGRHGDHSEYACSMCHGGGGTGTATHGNSNRVKKNPTNVIVNLPAGITFTSNGSTTTGGGTCNGTCHEETHTNRSW